jgi:hypothetical protein
MSNMKHVFRFSDVSYTMLEIMEALQPILKMFIYNGKNHMKKMRRAEKSNKTTVCVLIHVMVCTNGKALFSTRSQISYPRIANLRIKLKGKTKDKCDARTHFPLVIQLPTPTKCRIIVPISNSLLDNCNHCSPGEIKKMLRLPKCMVERVT